MKKAIEVIQERRSCKSYKPDMVSREEIDEVIKAGMNAPTGGNKQSPIIIAVTNKELRDDLSAENGRIAGAPEGFDVFYGAPVVLIVLADKSCPDHVYDGSLCMGNMLNAAYALGLGARWIHRAKQEFESDFGKNILNKLGIEGDYEGIGHCILGYPNGPLPDAPERKADYVYYAD